MMYVLTCVCVFKCTKIVVKITGEGERLLSWMEYVYERNCVIMKD